jgi:hypothetical protein
MGLVCKILQAEPMAGSTPDFLVPELLLLSDEIGNSSSCVVYGGTLRGEAVCAKVRRSAVCQPWILFQRRVPTFTLLLSRCRPST